MFIFPASTLKWYLWTVIHNFLSNPADKRTNPTKEETEAKTQPPLAEVINSYMVDSWALLFLLRRLETVNREISPLPVSNCSTARRMRICICFKRWRRRRRLSGLTTSDPELRRLSLHLRRRRSNLVSVTRRRHLKTDFGGRLSKDAGRPDAEAMRIATLIIAIATLLRPGLCSSPLTSLASTCCNGLIYIYIGSE